MNELVVTENLSKIYRIGEVEYPALRDLDISFYEGEFAAVVGPSGSGKSKLLHLIGGLDKPTKGRVLVTGSDISHMRSDELAEYRNRKIGFIFQFFNLIQYLTAVENVGFPMSVAGLSQKIRKAKAMELLEIFGLEKHASKKPSDRARDEERIDAYVRVG